jgi:hypothetical protein
LKNRLLTGDATFTIALQFRTNPDLMPLDRATARCEEVLSTPVAVATLTLPQQDISSEGEPECGENLALPVGSLAEARKVVYEA